jgi:hypothetical protein
MKPYFNHRIKIKFFLSEVTVSLSKFRGTPEVEEGTCEEPVRKKA